MDPYLGSGAQKPQKRIAIVTPDLMGPIRNGGVGTAYSALAELLADEGHDVTIIFANGISDDDSAFHLWQKRYKKKNITLLSLREPKVRLEHLYPARLSYAVFEMMKGRHFDIVHFADMYGLGYFCQLAKRQGLEFQSTLFCVILNGPQAWSLSANAQLPEDLDTLQTFYFEKKSVEWADVLVSPSQYALHWAQSEGWALPQKSFSEQYVMPTSAKTLYKGSRKALREIVFFGRLETRKGLELFCSAIERLPSRVLQNVKVTFLGRYGLVGGKSAKAFLNTCRKAWKCESEVIFDFNQEEALAYLRDTAPLVVIPSKAETLGFTVMECLEAGIPFIASRIPAFQELIADEDQDQVLFGSTAPQLAAHIQAILEKGAPKAKLRKLRQETNEAWARWHREVPLAVPAEKLPCEKPLVSVCITHKNRPQFLKQAISSILAQTYENFELVLIDDGSDDEEARILLSELCTRFRERDWKIFIQKNSEGPGACRNLAAELARGDYLLLMDDDNIAKPEEIATLISVAQKTGADIVTCGFDRFTGKIPDPFSEGTAGRFIGIGDDLNQAVSLNVFGDTNSLYRRQAFLDLGGHSIERGVAYEDYDLFLRAVLKGYRLEACPEALFWYREHEKQYTQEADPFRTLSFRMKNFSHFQGQDLRPFLAFMHSLQSRQVASQRSISRRQNPLINPQRTELFTGMLNRVKWIAGAEKKSISSKGAKIRWQDALAKVQFTEADGSLSFLFQKNKKEKPSQYCFSIQMVAVEAVNMKLEYQRFEGKGSRAVILQPGKNDINLRLSGADLSRPIHLRSKEKTAVHIQDFGLYEILGNADS